MSSVVGHVKDAAHAAHAHVAALLSHNQAKPGDKLPLNETVKETDATTPITLAPSGKNIFVGVPGAFTPTCHSQAPGYIEKYDEFKAKGINEIHIVCVNDVFVTKAWKEKLAPDGTPVRFIADDKALFVSKLGLVLDATPALGAPRSKRFVIIANDDIIETIIVEESAGELTVTEATVVLARL
ncbi:Redoxin-domain-containing protein [Russula ochroleuca]|uniref:Redoxin-domain-containing protein n=1 Tax=Russula ochroleuca TaxID=152965 RepID=A0A9P5JWD0_9AGAM|nr:Redoxin-domain-containing protein [Russula ochroleuca]